MAIDPRISLAIQGPSLAPGSQVISTFQNALTQAQNRRGNEQVIDQREITNPLNAQILQQQAASGEQQAQVDTENRTMQLLAEQGSLIKPVLESGNTEQALAMFNGLREKLAEANLPTQGTDRIIQQLQSGDTQGVLGAIDAVQQNARGRGLLGRGQAKSAGQAEFENLLSIAQNPNSTQVEKDSANRALGNLAKVGSLTSQERLGGDEALTTAVAGSQAEIEGARSGAREGEKLKQQRKHTPAIRALVKLAEKEATERGDTLTALQRSQAALPGLTDAVNQLKELSSLATSTFGGKVFDFAVKQTGFGATKGSTARAKFIAIVNNQVLPLLKETFGAAFTATEGESLKATMGDPDASPEEKMVQLDAFIDQKLRDIKTKETQLELSAGSLNQLTDISDDELFK